MLNFQYILNRMADPILRASLTDREVDREIRGAGDLCRDWLFENILKSDFKNRPLRVFQVGAIESLETKFRIGSGWSELFWGEHIKEHGGELHVCDINLNHIAHSHFAASNLGYHVNLHVSDASERLKIMFPEDDKSVAQLPFDLYYLDGADEPHGNQQTLDQFNLVESHNALYLVDDVPTKGQMLLKYLELKYGEISDIVTHYNCGNGMMLIDLREVTNG